VSGKPNSTRCGARPSENPSTTGLKGWGDRNWELIRIEGRNKKKKASAKKAYIRSEKKIEGRSFRYRSSTKLEEKGAALRHGASDDFSSPKRRIGGLGKIQKSTGNYRLTAGKAGRAEAKA